MSVAFCFDLDGTVSKDEILPLLSIEIGLFEEISALTEATIKGVIPFEKSFRLRCRLLSDIPVSTIQSIIKTVRLYSMISDFIRNNSEHCFIVTGNLDVWIAPLVQSLGCGFYSSIGLVEADRLVSVEKVLNKADAIADVRSRFNRVVSIGDGMGDVSMFEASDIGIAFGATHDPIETLIQNSNYVAYDERSLCRLLNTLL